MNNSRRKTLDNAVACLNQANNIIESAMEEEDDCLSNMPESLSESERGIEMEQAIENMEDAVSKIEEAIELVREAEG